jgi:hypothetical protein
MKNGFWLKAKAHNARASPQVLADVSPMPMRVVLLVGEAAVVERLR